MNKIVMIIALALVFNVNANANACHGGAFGSGDYRNNYQTKIWRN